MQTLVPVFAYQTIDGANLIPDVCVGARERVQSVCLVTRDRELDSVRSVALDSSSRTSVALTKIIFREFLNSEPEWKTTEPDINAMLAAADSALLIGDPALRLAGHGYKVFDLAESLSHRIHRPRICFCDVDDEATDLAD